MPDTVIRCAATVPAGTVPAAISMSSRRDRHLAAGVHVVEAETERVGDRAQRRAEALPAVFEAGGIQFGGWRAEPHDLEQQLGGVAR